MPRNKECVNDGGINEHLVQSQDDDQYVIGEVRNEERKNEKALQLYYL